MFVLLDVSKSMLTEDVRPNRLAQAKFAVEDLLAHGADRRVGALVGHERDGPAGGKDPGHLVEGRRRIEPVEGDADDDGDGFPDQVDQSSGAGTATPTAQYDTINGLNTSITWRQPAINYNYLAKMYTDPAKLRTELSKLNSEAFTMSIRLVAPFVTQTSGVTIKDAWVDCTGLAWCVTDDSGSTLPIIYRTDLRGDRVVLKTSAA